MTNVGLKTFAVSIGAGLQFHVGKQAVVFILDLI